MKSLRDRSIMERVGMVAIMTFASLAIAETDANVTSNRLATAIGVTNRLERVSPREVLAGTHITNLLTTALERKPEKTTVIFSGPGMTHEVRWGRWQSNVVVPGETNYPALEVVVPNSVLAEPSKPDWITVRLNIDGTDCEGRSGIHVYPATYAKLLKINDRGPDSDPPPTIDWNGQVRVTGSGFVAPMEQIMVKVGGSNFTVIAVDPSGNSLLAQRKTNGQGISAMGALPEHLGEQKLEITAWGAQIDQGGLDRVWVEDATQLTWPRRLWVGFGVAIPLALLLALCRLCVFKRFKPALTFLVDPVSNTYSLSRFQLLWWLGLLLFSYAYVFVARGLFVANVWKFYSLSGSAYVLIISFGTLVGSMATTAIVGFKGGGPPKPQWGDLVTQGGVLALERVQQLLITVLAGLMYIWIVIRTSPTTAEFPTIPDSLLVLMGASSSAYILGKGARKAGPNIRNVTKTPGDKIKIEGLCLSTDTKVTVNKQDVTGTLGNEEGDVGTLTADAPPGTDWSRKVNVIVTNVDKQQAAWEGFVA